MGVDSEEGQGSTFWCLIPLKPATGSVPTHVTLHTPARPSRRRPVQPLVGSSPRTRILLAEDNAINQQLVVRLLERVGYRVDVAANGQEALESHQRAPCDAILMDYQIPEMSGLTATAEIRRREGITTHTPIIAMTADCRQEDRDRCIGIGMDDLIPKPLDRDVLYETLGRVLGASTEPECSKPDVH